MSPVFGQVPQSETKASKDQQRLVDVTADVEARVSRDREVTRSRDQTVETLIAIITDESKPDGSRNLIEFAMQQLALYPDSDAAVKFLVQRIDFQAHNLTNSDPLYRFPAAKSLVAIGVPARRWVLGSLARPLTDRKLHLVAVVLAAADQTGHDDHYSGPPIAAFRLQRLADELEQDSVEPEGQEGRKTTILNLRRLVVLLNQKGILVRRPPQE